MICDGSYDDVFFVPIMILAVFCSVVHSYSPLIALSPKLVLVIPLYCSIPFSVLCFPLVVVFLFLHHSSYQGHWTGPS